MAIVTLNNTMNMNETRKFYISYEIFYSDETFGKETCVSLIFLHVRGKLTTIFSETLIVS